MQCFRDAGHIALGLIAVVVLILLALIIPAMAIFTLVGRTQKVQVCRGGVWCVGEGCGVWGRGVVCGEGVWCVGKGCGVWGGVWVWGRGKGLVCGERLDVKREGVMYGGRDGCGKRGGGKGG